MSSRCPERFAFAALALALIAGPAAAADANNDAAAASAARPVLRVCADPDNLPFSSEDGTGFENRIAQLVARDLGAQLHYFWLPQRRGFVRKTLGEGHCDVFMGVPAALDRVLTTRPYYRSSYAFLHRAGDRIPASLEPGSLAGHRVGVQLVGNDLAATPAGHALVNAGAIDNVIGYTVYGHGPAVQRIAEDLASGRLDTALVWGPQAGYFARRVQPALEVEVARAPAGLPVPFEFSIAMGVRKEARPLREALDAILVRRKPEIDAILASFGVPRTDTEGARP